MKKKAFLAALVVMFVVSLCSPSLKAQTSINNLTILPCEGGGEQGLPKTGQQICYDAAGDPTSCSASGQDAEYADPTGSYDVGLQQGESSWANYWTNRFTESSPGGDDVVVDNVTGLMWAADGSEEGCYYGGTRTWEQALTWAEGLDFAGYQDWRLPNAYELFSICLLEPGAISGVKASGAPYINQTVFPNTVSSFYLSSTTYPSSTGLALGVHFGSGSVSLGGKSNAYCVRAVRGGT